MVIALHRNYQLNGKSGLANCIIFCGSSLLSMVKIRESPQRPRYYCERCDRDFPSMLDLEEHRKIDHATTVSTA